MGTTLESGWLKPYQASLTGVCNFLSMAVRSHQPLPLLPSHLCVGSKGDRAEEKNILASCEQDPSLRKGYSPGQEM